MDRLEEATRDTIWSACELAVDLRDECPNTAPEHIASAVLWAIDQCGGFEDEEAVAASAKAHLLAYDPETRA